MGRELLFSATEIVQCIRLRAHLLRVTALSGAIFAALPAHAVPATLPQDLWGFEGGTLAGWTSYGGASVVATDSLSLGGTAFEVSAKGGYMAKLLPAGSTVVGAQAEGLLGLAANSFANSGGAGLAAA